MMILREKGYFYFEVLKRALKRWHLVHSLGWEGASCMGVLSGPETESSWAWKWEQKEGFGRRWLPWDKVKRKKKIMKQESLTCSKNCEMEGMFMLVSTEEMLVRLWCIWYTDRTMIVKYKWSAVEGRFKNNNDMVRKREFIKWEGVQFVWKDTEL